MVSTREYDQAMRNCIEKGIKIYPIYKSNMYQLEINYQGWLHLYEERYKMIPRYKKDKIWYKEIRKLYELINYLNTNMKEKHILEKAFEIIHDRSGDKARDYGDFHDSMKDAAKIMTTITGVNISTRNFYIAMMSLKLARLRHSDKYDTYLDLLAYVASMSTLKEVELQKEELNADQ